MELIFVCKMVSVDPVHRNREKHLAAYSHARRHIVGLSRAIHTFTHRYVQIQFTRLYGDLIHSAVSSVICPYVLLQLNR